MSFQHETLSHVPKTPSHTNNPGNVFHFHVPGCKLVSYPDLDQDICNPGLFGFEYTKLCTSANIEMK